ncbi:uncharacterized protein TNCV_1781991 [Trichonephila clavipes]|nr:uncharacterized protein TNCV_1781991 [Trichonephila clavipes]
MVPAQLSTSSLDHGLEDTQKLQTWPGCEETQKESIPIGPKSVVVNGGGASSGKENETNFPGKENNCDVNGHVHPNDTQDIIGEERNEAIVLKNISRMLIGRTIESSRCDRPRWHRIQVITGEPCSNKVAVVEESRSFELWSSDESDTVSGLPHQWEDSESKQVAAVAEWYRYRIVACLVTSSSPVPLKTLLVGQRCTLNLSRAETSSRWCGVVVRRRGASSGVVHVT